MEKLVESLISGDITAKEIFPVELRVQIQLVESSSKDQDQFIFRVFGKDHGPLNREATSRILESVEAVAGDLGLSEDIMALTQNKKQVFLTAQHDKLTEIF